MNKRTEKVESNSSKVISLSTSRLHKPDQLGDGMDGLRILAKLIAQHHMAWLRNTRGEVNKLKRNDPD